MAKFNIHAYIGLYLTQENIDNVIREGYFKIVNVDFSKYRPIDIDTVNTQDNIYDLFNHPFVRKLNNQTIALVQYNKLCGYVTHYKGNTLIVVVIKSKLDSVSRDNCEIHTLFKGNREDWLEFAGHNLVVGLTPGDIYNNPETWWTYKDESGVYYDRDNSVELLQQYPTEETEIYLERVKPLFTESMIMNITSNMSPSLFMAKLEDLPMSFDLAYLLVLRKHFNSIYLGIRAIKKSINSL